MHSITHLTQALQSWGLSNRNTKHLRPEAQHVDHFTDGRPPPKEPHEHNKTTSSNILLTILGHTFSHRTQSSTCIQSQEKALNVHTYCMLYVLALNVRTYCTESNILLFIFSDKCTHCKSLWIKASAKVRKCKCKWTDHESAFQTSYWCTLSHKFSHRRMFSAWIQ